jgi:putative transposase
MAGRRHKPEEIIGKLREAEIVLAQGGTVPDACRRIGVTEQTYYRWRKGKRGLFHACLGSAFCVGGFCG